jgi:serine/threonine protein kinase
MMSEANWISRGEASLRQACLHANVPPLAGCGPGAQVKGMVTRFCPKCGSQTGALFCPDDGIATFELATRSPSRGVLQPGDIVAERYRVTALLGQGGHGAVYEAHHLGGLGLVALKVLSVGQADQVAMRRFFREARVTAGLKHANTVRMFDLGQMPDGTLFLVMERLHGVTLEDLLRRRLGQDAVLDQAEAIDIALEVLQSLSEAHGQGLVHRDLKPANIMLTQVDGERCVKVLDFGIAWAQDAALTTTGHAVGTPMYMSPEQCSTQPVDVRSDLYSLAVILFRCVVGRPPFVDPQALALMYAHNHMPPPSLVEATRTAIGPGFAAAVARGLAKQPSDRFDSARQMRAALQAARGEALTILPRTVDVTQDQLPVATPPRSMIVSPPTPQAASILPAPRARRSPRWPLALAASGLVLAGAAWSLTRPHVTQDPVVNTVITPASVVAPTVPLAPRVAVNSTLPVATAPAVAIPAPSVTALTSAVALPPTEALPVRGQHPPKHQKSGAHAHGSTADHGIEATLPGDD